MRIAVYWPAIVACLLGGTQKYNNRRITLFDMPHISNICIPTSCLRIAYCPCNFFFWSGRCHCCCFNCSWWVV